MNKEINELDRMTVGVREWAVEGIMRQLVTIGANYLNTEVILGDASKLEKYVIGEIGKEKS